MSTIREPRTMKPMTDKEQIDWADERREAAMSREGKWTPGPQIARPYARNEWSVTCGCRIISGKETDAQGVCKDEMLWTPCLIHNQATQMAEALATIRNLTDGHPVDAARRDRINEISRAALRAAGVK